MKQYKVGIVGATGMVGQRFTRSKGQGNILQILSGWLCSNNLLQIKNLLFHGLISPHLRQCYDNCCTDILRASHIHTVLHAKIKLDTAVDIAQRNTC